MAKTAAPPAKEVIDFSQPLMVEAAQAYGFSAIPNPVTLSKPQVESIKSIAVVLGDRDAEIARLRRLIESAKLRMPTLSVS